MTYEQEQAYLQKLIHISPTKPIANENISITKFRGQVITGLLKIDEAPQPLLQLLHTS